MNKYINITRQSQIAAKVKLYKKLYDVTEVCVQYTGLALNADKKKTYLVERELSEDLTSIDWYGRQIPFKMIVDRYNGANILITTNNNY